MTFSHTHLKSLLAAAIISASALTSAQSYGNAPGGNTMHSGGDWLRCALGQAWNGTTCTGDAKDYTFEEAEKAVAQFNANGGYAGKTDWRLPTIRELITLRVCSTGLDATMQELEDSEPPVNAMCNENAAKPTTDTAKFPNTAASWFWSSTVVDGKADNTWYVNFNDGFVNNDYQTESYNVRLVRK